MAYIKNDERNLSNGYKVKKVMVNDGFFFYAVLQYKSILKILKVFKIWQYVRDEKTKQVRMFKDLRSAQAYINYQTNPEMYNRIEITE